MYRKKHLEIHLFFRFSTTLTMAAAVEILSHYTVVVPDKMNVVQLVQGFLTKLERSVLVELQPQYLIFYDDNSEDL